MRDGGDRVIGRRDLPVGELTLEGGAVALRRDEEVKPRNCVSGNREELDHLAVHVPAAELAYVHQDDSLAKPERVPAGFAHRRLPLDRLDIGAAGNHEHVLARRDAEQHPPHALGEHHRSGGAAQRHALDVLCQPERDAVLAPAARVDVLLCPQAPDVEDQRALAPGEARRKQSHRSGHVATGVDRVELVAADEPGRHERPADCVEGRRGK